MEVKGSAVLSSIAFVEDTFGAEAHDQVCQAISADLGKAFPRRLLAANWYDLALLLDYMKTAKRKLAPQNVMFYREMGRFSAEYALNKFYRFLVSLSTTERVVRRGAAVWSSYYRPGRLNVLQYDKRSATLRLEDFPHDSKEFCERLIGWFERVTEMTGGKNPRIIHTRCQADGAPYCEFHGAWQT